MVLESGVRASARERLVTIQEIKYQGVGLAPPATISAGTTSWVAVQLRYRRLAHLRFRAEPAVVAVTSRNLSGPSQ